MLLKVRHRVLGMNGFADYLIRGLLARPGTSLRTRPATNPGYRVRKYIGSYVAAMGGLDTVIFTGGIGQGSEMVRACL